MPGDQHGLAGEEVTSPTVLPGEVSLALLFALAMCHAYYSERINDFGACSLRSFGRPEHGAAGECYVAAGALAHIVSYYEYSRFPSLYEGLPGLALLA